jgi:hypothetical protein
MKKLLKFVCFGMLLTIVLFACKSESRKESQSARTIPNDVKYSIIETNVLPKIKRSLDVRLNKRVSEDALRLIALELKSQDSKRYERTFIAYYLPDMKVGEGAWATTHFDPDLEVRILGLTAVQKEKLTSEPEDSSREVIGKWLYEVPYLGCKITIYRQNGKLYMEKKYHDGSSSNEEIVEKASNIGRRFQEKGALDSGDYYVLDKSGNLQIRDQEGLVGTAKKIR